MGPNGGPPPTHEIDAVRRSSMSLNVEKCGTMSYSVVQNNFLIFFASMTKTELLSVLSMWWDEKSTSFSNNKMYNKY